MLKALKTKKENEVIDYVNFVNLTVILKDIPKITEFKQKIAISSDVVKVVNVQVSWAGLNYTTLSIYEEKLQKEFLKLKEHDIILIEGKLHNRYYPNKTTHKTFFSIEVEKFKKIGKKRKNK
ncbi:hypothetical protein [Spiroplasma endosymbiont of Clivina fossor]|uniref:hypothetical protein n=1 Tax=Spiroplasma endosymbiont of Clivina fossor TaxID=3066282 RepID=UPI00313CC878